MPSSLQIAFLAWIALPTQGKIFDRCELGYELIDEKIVPNDYNESITKWVCISHHATGYNTSFYAEETDVAKSYGPLKISNIWCDDGMGSQNECGVDCALLQTTNISETVRCANMVYEDAGSFWHWFAFREFCTEQTGNYTVGCTRTVTFTSFGGNHSVPINLVEGTEAEIICSSKGYPVPERRWEWDTMGEDLHINVTIDPGPDPDTQIEYFARLKFQAVRFSDAKEYICYAENKNENKTQVFSVSVSAPSSAATEGTSASETTTDGSATQGPTTIASTTTDNGITEDTTMVSSGLPSTTLSTYSPTTNPSSSSATEVNTEPVGGSTWTTQKVNSTTITTITSPTTPRSTTTPDPLAPTTPAGEEKIYEECELAGKLSYVFGKTFNWTENIEKWVCLSENATSFNGSFLQFSEDQLVHYGIFKISNRWCNDVYDNGNPCNIGCNELFEQNLQPQSAQNGFMTKTDLTNGPSKQQYVLTGYRRTFMQNASFHRILYLSTDPERKLGSSKVTSTNTLPASGRPPPNLECDSETMNYIATSGGRIQEDRGNQTEGNGTIWYRLTLTHVDLLDERVYRCDASNIAGSDNQTITVSVEPAPEPKSDWKQALLIGGGSTLGLLGLIAIPVTYILYRMRKKRNENLLRIYEEFKYGHESDVTDSTILADDLYSHLPDPQYATYQKILTLPFSKDLEIQPDRLEFNEAALLGSGAFGVVFQGMLDNKVVVAVKTVPKHADESKLSALLSEVKIMSYVGKHPNIVQLLGVQMVDLRKGLAFAVVEYCSRGSLEGVLHAKRRQLGYMGKFIPSGYSLAGYLSSAPTVPKAFSTYQLLTFAHQVCSAMDFLASKRIIHGDLAARNVLLDVNYVAKISDFGLSRQIYDEYKKYVFATKETALPWRWLAIETLKNLKFSTESDVWAFGVLTWEIFSLAELPYTAGISWGPQFVKYLENGFRLQSPEFATPEIYQLMRKCWMAEPGDRANFQQLSIRLLSLLESEYKTNNY